ncbi:MAG TPA: NADH-quinone oxidoreductase subunit J [Anaerolineales bacterium]|nr:NADH-quinone oxidoreductase subunit J [Anaerolineales bacterium]
MTPVQLIFLAVAAVTLAAALMVVLTRNLIHAALWLIVTLFGVAVFYVLLNAGFFAVVQVVVYIGAIAILFIFAAMLTRRVMQDTGPQLNAGSWLAGLVAVLSFGGLVAVLSQWPGFSSQAAALPEGADPLVQLGTALVSPDAYVLPFELASVLLVAAMIGAITVSLEKKP